MPQFVASKQNNQAKNAASKTETQGQLKFRVESMDDLNETQDVVFCIDVLQHYRPHEMRRLLAHVASKAERVKI